MFGRCYILIRFPPATTEMLLQAFTTAFRDLSQKIEGIISFEFGLNNSTEGLNRGMTHVFNLTFASAQARDAYLQHPERAKFVEWVNKLNVVEELMVIDYIPQD